MKQLSFEQFNTEINEFYTYLRDNRTSEAEIRRILAPVLTNRPKKARFARYVLIAIVLAVCYLLSGSETVSWHVSAVARIALIKLLPYWNWAPLKNEKCLLAKPGPPPLPAPAAFQCELCENLRTIDVHANLTRTHLKRRYLDVDVPVIVRNQLAEWRRDDFVRRMLADGRLAASTPCQLATNVVKTQKRAHQLRALVQQVGYFRSFFVHFQNCNFHIVKQFRLLTPRPNVLPVDLSPVQYSWFVWNRNYSSGGYKMIDLIEPIGVYAQIAGSSIVRLKPRNNCEEACRVIEVLLKEGEIAIFTQLWNLEYGFEGKEENMAAILEMH